MKREPCATEPRTSLWFQGRTANHDWLNVRLYGECGREFDMKGVSPREAAFVMDALDAFGLRFGHVANKSCWCEVRGIGQAGVSCGDCWRDYEAAVQRVAP